MTNSPYISLNEAAKLTGRAKSTISKALKSGKMSYVSLKQNGNGNDEYEIDPAEALRAFPKRTETAIDDQQETPEKTPGNSVLAMELQAIKERLQEVIESRNHERQLQQDERQQFLDQIEDLRTRLDQEGQERRQLTAMLTDQRKPEQPPARSWWPWNRKSA